MKDMVKYLFISVFLFITFTLFESVDAFAKNSSSSIFEVIVGEEKLPIYYKLEENNGIVKEKMQFVVKVNGVSEVKNSYIWEHKFCYSINNGEEVCEIDLTGKNQENSDNVFSNRSYTYYFYDEDMPFYSEDLIFDYIRFENKFTCLDCDGENSPIVLENIVFNSNEINYKYTYSLDVESKIINDYEYVNGYTEVLFVNNDSSTLKLASAPIYSVINEICVEENNCIKEEVSSVSDQNGKKYNITPYLGNISYYYNAKNLLTNDSNYTSINYKTILKCTLNCDSRRVENNFVVYNKTLNLDYKAPNEDLGNTIIESYDEVNYIKSTTIKITIEDNGSGIEEESLFYYLGWHVEDSCNISSSDVYSFENGVAFELGSNLKDGAICMYYTASDKMGNKYKSDYYYFYFDNNGPTINFINQYNSNQFYNEIIISPLFNDNYSGLKDVFYFLSEEIISSEEYLEVKNNGEIFSNGESIQLDNDGSYYVYVLAYDNLNNYRFGNLGVFNLDTIPLSVEEVDVVKENISDEYNNRGYITISIKEMKENDKFSCGFSNKENVTESDLIMECYNN